MVLQRKNTTAPGTEPVTNTPELETNAETPPLRIRREEPVVSVGRDTLAGFRKEWDEERVKSALGDLASRKRSLENVLLELVKSVQTAVTTSLRDTTEWVTADARLDAEHREQLLVQKPVRKAGTSKTGYRVSGQVLHPKTGEPVSGLVVEAMDRGVRKHDLSGTAVTDAQGRFSIAFQAKEFEESGENAPEIELRIGVSRRTLLHVTKEAITARKGEETEVSITLPEAQVPRLDNFTETRESLSPARLRRANETALRHRLDVETMKTVGSAVQGLLQAGVEKLEARAQGGK